MSLSELDRGIYASGQFIELVREERVNKETGAKENADYVIITTGGRKGTFAIKFDVSALSREAFGWLNGMKLGDDFFAKVRVSAFQGAVYYTLVDVLEVV